MKFLVKIDKGKLSFGSEFNKARFNEFLKDNEGRVLRIAPTTPKVSEQMRGYYFGAVIPLIKQTIPEWKEISSDDLHEILKQEFNYFEVLSPIDKKVKRYGKSIASSDSNSTKMMEYIHRIGDWLETNYNVTLPDAVEFKRYYESAPLKDVATVDNF